MAITARTEKGLASHPCAMPGDEVEAVLAHPFMVGVGVLLVWVVLRLGFARRRVVRPRTARRLWRCVVAGLLTNGIYLVWLQW